MIDRIESFRSPRISPRALAALTLMVAATGCPHDALLFYEGAKLGFTAQYKPGDSQPVKAHLGFDRRIAAIVPPQYGSPDNQNGSKSPGWPTDESGQPLQDGRRGDALAVVSTFEVKAHAMSGVEVHNYFATGNAAIALTAPAKTGGGAPTHDNHLLNLNHLNNLPALGEGASDVSARVGALLGPAVKPSWPTASPIADHVSP